MKYHMLNLTSARWLNRHRRGCEPNLAPYRLRKPLPEPSLQKTDLGSFVAWWQISQRGHAAASGWNYRHQVLDGSFQKQTTTDTFSGAGILHAGQRDSRFVTLFSATDNTKARNLSTTVNDEFSGVGVTGGKWARLRFRVQFANHPPKGWSTKALCRWGYGRIYSTQEVRCFVTGAKHWPAALFSAGQ